ncbi:aminotransferase class I/II-fold pyridoxal phosphate-dependent enzyme [Nocardioides sp. ChNu-153]|uniref:aminotransferase class I/II-fold pyridoxal phosphate-dependent enzyme n=1 Tax=unclassified Nocardioides TaxID=2615069 RepID=UPI00240768A9|nr:MULTISPECIES: aminotransferase class I/II-fold pyridoxal phosphate-dependent enzyme [unclassified Nocardioides]MDF9716084.1 aminotransferase class I/II-fold pyridoxal phosphate-dependent enzyme [Nocardioides sp. ChNu-99]MDN7120360.1 aminotransferase class I/II-fold pyridoxal phosphate-dependent enzyme [Nocardioides sp. ChNu-153]
MALPDLAPADLAAFADAQRAAYAELKAKGLKLDLTRGKPSPEQLDLSEGLLSLPSGHVAADGTDVRNYGGLAGLPELRAIFAELLGTSPANVVAAGNSSLTLMHDTLVQSLLYGRPSSPEPWGVEDVVRFLCPVPGYDRHFALADRLGIELVPVPLTDEGPDTEVVATMVADDPTIKGMWLVPTYANPTGSVCSVEVARTLASMPTAAPDFTILWDNAYAVHHLTDVETATPDILGLAAEAGNPDRVVMFASTSKITFAGAGVAFLAGSDATVAAYLEGLGFYSIGPDKVNQLRHVEFFGDAEGVRAHMRRHRDLIAPKFAEVQRILGERLTEHGIAEWTDPAGGYFVSLDVLDGTARRVVQLAKEAGIALTPAGSSFPYGEDPRDRNIRLAPTLPPVAEVTAAMEGVATCVLLAAAESLQG